MSEYDKDVHDMFGYYYSDGEYAAAPAASHNGTFMKIYRFKEGRFYPILRNGYRKHLVSGEYEPWPILIGDGKSRGTTQLRADRTINITMVNNWDLDGVIEIIRQEASK